MRGWSLAIYLIGWLVAAGCLVATGCGTRACRPGTLFLHLSLDGASAAADNFAVTVDVDGQLQMGTGSHTPGAAEGTLEISFGSYPKGHSVIVTVVALANDVELGRGSSPSTRLSASCESLQITVGSGGSDLGDLGANDDQSVVLDGGSDGNPRQRDLASGPDLATCVPDTSGARYVDNALGTDDELHGNAPGACANRSLTYALAHATSVSLQDGGVYADDGGESLPFILRNGQQLKCNGSSLIGTGVYLTINNSTVIAFPSTMVSGCEMHAHNGNDGISLYAPDGGGNDGGALIDSCEFFDYHVNGISNATGGSNFVISHSKFFRINTLGLLLANGNGSFKDNQFEAIGAVDIQCDDGPNPAMTGCGNHSTDGGAITCGACANCSTFSNVCP